MKDRFKYVEVNFVERNTDELLENQFYMSLNEIVTNKLIEEILKKREEETNEEAIQIQN